ncbi:unnamed protein product [Leuciscus chuanchicus]
MTNMQVSRSRWCCGVAQELNRSPTLTVWDTILILLILIGASSSSERVKLSWHFLPSLEARGAFELLWKVLRSGPVPGPLREQALVGGRGGLNWGQVPPYCEVRASGQHR